MQCEYKLSSGATCGIESRKVDRGLCRFHSYVKDGVYSGGGRASIKEFVQKTPHNVVDFAKITFRRMQFSSDIFDENKGLRFSRSVLEDCRFTDCTIPNALFDDRAVLSRTTFDNCVFTGNKCSFDTAQLSAGEPIFCNCKFKLNSTDLGSTIVSFRGTTLETGSSAFDNTHCFATDLNLNQSHFKTEFLTIMLTGPLDNFSAEKQLCLHSVSAIHANDLRFRGVFHIHQDHTVSHPTRINLEGFDSSNMVSATLKGIDLTESWFTNADIRDMQFLNVKWCTDKHGIKVLSEDLADSGSSVDTLEGLVGQYVQLKNRYEARGDHIGASDWYFREMDCRLRAIVRKRKVARKKIPGLQELIMRAYRYTCRFGEEFSKPIVLLLFVWLFFSPLYLFSGFISDGTVVNYDWMRGAGFSWRHVADLVESAVVSLSVMALQLKSGSRPVGASSLVLSIAQIVMSVSLISLFLLSLRRKLKR